MEVRSLAIGDVKIIVPRRFEDSRGYFVETYNQRAAIAAGVTATFVQDNQSLSTRRGTVRGLHFQRAPEPQAKLVRIVAGSVFDVAVDLRAGSATYGKWCGATLSAEGGEQLYIPVGFAHGFCTLEDETTVAYKVDGFYNKSAEGGLRWNDPDLAIAWPLPAADIHVSERDAVMPCLRDVAEMLGF